MNYPMDKWQQILDLNLTGLFQLSAMAAKVMKEQGPRQNHQRYLCSRHRRMCP
jgi:NAD(P)-dependent dehydrogenase (short-subunit alcohol dehydrogenase family)